MKIDPFTYLFTLGFLTHPLSSDATVSYITNAKAYWQQPTIDSLSDSLQNFLSQQTVPIEQFQKQYLYTWTTKQQIQHVRKTGQLLYKSQSDDGQKALFDLLLKESSFQNSEFGKIMQKHKFKNKRFAWANLWASALGWKDEQYGRHLIRVKLKEDAIVAYFNPYYSEVQFMQYHKPLENPSLEILEEKLAAVYFINEHYNIKNVKTPKKFVHSTLYLGRKRIPKYSLINSALYREYILVNENMLENWEYATEGLLEDWKQCLSSLEQVQEYLETNDQSLRFNNNIKDRLIYVWKGRFPSNYQDIEKNYYNSIAFSGKDYRLDYKNMERIVKRLQKNLKQQGQSLEARKKE